ncbi:MAG: polymerase subunit sigma-24 [Clostridia bacterium]|nr:polymerase subunit sigma-24 [Clostridia bacterium]
MNDIEKLLIKKSKSGDVEAFEQLIFDYQKKAYNIALRIMGNQEDAKDMCQEAFIRIFKSIEGFKEQSSFSTWMYRIVTNVCLDEIRRKKKNDTVSLDNTFETQNGEVHFETASDEDTPEEAFIRTEKRRIILKEINSLSEEYKTAIVLRDIQGFSYEEIANILCCSIGTVKSRINRGRNILKNRLKTALELSGQSNVYIAERRD